ncbi:FHA domain-containing protein [Planctomycetaceae bacterium SH139]
MCHDELLSSRHAAVTRQRVSGTWRWVITDLQSRNGVFFRVSKAPLSHGSDFLVGNGCYKFELVQKTEPETAAWNNIQAQGPTTRAYQADLPAGTATISEVIRGGTGTRIRLSKDAYTMGRSNTCDIPRSNDPCSAPFHAHLQRSEKGTWMIKNNGSRNGVWLRLPQIVIPQGKNCDFHAGEQRFRLSFRS